MRRLIEQCFTTSFILCYGTFAASLEALRARGEDGPSEKMGKDCRFSMTSDLFLQSLCFAMSVGDPGLSDKIEESLRIACKNVDTDGNILVPLA